MPLFPKGGSSTKKERKLKRRESIKGWSLVSPYIAHQTVFFGYALAWLGYLMFVKWNYLTPPKFVGVDNFVKVIQDETFWLVLGNTFNFMLYFIPISLLGSVLLGMAFTKLKYFKTFVVLSFLIANISSGVSYSIVFQKLLSESGPANRFLYEVFGFTIPWFSQPQLAILAIALMVSWKFLGYYGLIFLAGLGAIPQSLYEAAELDGAGKWKRFTKITLPLLNPSMVMVLVMQITLSFGIFTEPYMITGGGPMKRTYMFMMYIYDNAFRKFTSTGPGYAAVISIFAAAISFGCIFLVRKLVEKEVNFV
jgi:multiple sugar transport system permease protein